MYYRLKALDEEQLGAKDGRTSAELIESKFLDKKNYRRYMSYFLGYGDNWEKNYTNFPETNLDLEYLRVPTKVPFTDFVYFTPSYYHKFLVNSRIQNILQQFKMPPYKLYPAKLVSKEVMTEDYKFIYSPSFDYEFVDFTRSVFSTGNKRTGNEYIKVKSAKELMESLEPMAREKIVLKNTFDRDLDFFNLIVMPDPIISHRLRDELLRQGASGINLVEWNENQFEIL